MSLTSLTAAEMREGLLKGDFSSLELTEAHLKRIEETNPEYQSFISVLNESAVISAKEADNIIAEKKDAAPKLTGIPIALKDNIVTKGNKTTCASKILNSFVSPYDSTVVKKLKANNAVIIGKTNMDEFAMGSSGENSSVSATKNPWDTSKVPGGSSSGSAVSVTSGQTPLALGSDTGGSIRQPASFCGVLGIKPSYGMVSRYGLVSYASSLDQIGTFARSVEDVAICLDVICGHDERDSTSVDKGEVNFYEELVQQDKSSLAGLKVGVPKEFFIPGMQEEVEGAVRDSIRALESLGAEIVEISLPHTKYAISTYYILASAEASSNLARYDGVRYASRAPDVENLSQMYSRTRQNGFGSEVKRKILMGNYVLSAGYYDAYYKKAQQVRTLILNDFKSVFANECDLIIAPVSPTTAFGIGEKTEDVLEMYLSDVFTLSCNLAGLPGMSIPCGLDNSGLPIGMQLLAPAFEESRLLRVAASFVENSDFDIAKQAGRVN